MSSPNNASEVGETPTTTPPEAGLASTTANVTTSEEGHHNEDAMEVDAKDEDDENDATISLPLSKIKKIFKMDPDFTGATQSAVFTTGVATELFIQYLTEQALAISKLEKRKKLLYKDVSTAVSSQDSLFFLNDTVPKTIPLKEVLQETDLQADHATTKSVEVEPMAIEKNPHKIDIKNMLPISKPKPSELPDQATAPPPVKKSAITNLVSNDNEA